MKPQGQSVFAFFLNILIKVLLVNVGIIVAVGLYGWFRGWNTGYQYGGGIVVAGIAMIVLGIASVMSFWRDTRSFEFQYGQSAGHQTIYERTQQSLNEALRRYSFQIQTALIGIVAIVIGSIIQEFF
jgi:hypothetical protein